VYSGGEAENKKTLCVFILVFLYDISMHEQSIVDSLLALALENAQKGKANKIRKINVVIGELSGAVDESMEFYFNFLRQGTLAEEAVLVFTHKPAELKCRKCQTVFTPSKQGYQCPKCKTGEVDIVGGRELYLESLEVE
jgi:hydrogenase nickel incorporation protein HypA/HybF